MLKNKNDPVAVLQVTHSCKVVAAEKQENVLLCWRDVHVKAETSLAELGYHSQLKQKWKPPPLLLHTTYFPFTDEIKLGIKGPNSTAIRSMCILLALGVTILKHICGNWQRGTPALGLRWTQGHCDFWRWRGRGWNGRGGKDWEGADTVAMSFAIETYPLCWLGSPNMDLFKSLPTQKWTQLGRDPLESQNCSPRWRTKCSLKEMSGGFPRSIEFNGSHFGATVVYSTTG